MFVRVTVFALVAVSVVTRAEASSTVAPEVCGHPPDMPEDVVPGVPFSNIIEPIGTGPNVCVGESSLVQEVIWHCDTIPCCTEPCVCHAGHHSEDGCGAQTPLKELRCYVQQYQPLRFHAWTCCSGFEMDEFRKCMPVVDCNAPGGSPCQHTCVPGTPDTCACPAGYDVTNRTQCTAVPSTTRTVAATTTSTTLPTTTSTTAPATEVPSSSTTTARTTTTTTTTTLPALTNPRSTPGPPTTTTMSSEPPVVDGQGGPNQEPSTYDEGSSNLAIILGILLPLLLLLLLCVLLICCCGVCRRKPPPTPRESVDAAFTNHTYGVIEEEEGAVGGTVLGVVTDKKKLPPDEVGHYDNAGYLTSKQIIDPPPPYTEKPLSTPVVFGVVAMDDTKKNPIYDNDYACIPAEKPPRRGDVAIRATLPNAYEEIPCARLTSRPAGVNQVATEQNEVNEISETIYYDIN